MSQWPHFNEDEFKCPCCGGLVIDYPFLDRLEIARVISGIPYIISSGFRCPIRNKFVGSGSQNHISGKAADILCLNSHDRIRIMVGLVQAGFRRIGVYQKHIHCDTMDLQEAIWLGS